MPPPDLDTVRAERLRRTLAAVSAAHPFYRARFRELSIEIDRIISPDDLDLYQITDDADQAVKIITRFYRNYHSLRYVNEQLVIRLQHQIPEELLARLNRDFRDILMQGDIVASGPVGDDADEVPELPRLLLWFDRAQFGRLRQLIDVINQY